MTRVANTQIGGHHAAALYRRLRWWRGLACGLLGLAVLTWALPAGTAQEQGLAQRGAALETLLKPFTRVGNQTAS